LVSKDIAVDMPQIDSFKRAIKTKKGFAAQDFQMLTHLYKADSELQQYVQPTQRPFNGEHSNEKKSNPI
jgi:hypothetical protein